MARPRKETPTVFYNHIFKLSEANHLLVEECYKTSGCRTRVQFLMEMIHNYDRIKKIQEMDDAMFDEILAHRKLLLNVTNNINQIAKEINTLGFAAEYSDIKVITEQMEALIPELKERSGELLKKTNVFMKKY
mgnify:CR=1 FL=1